MSLDLCLIPVDHDGGDWGFGHSLLELGGVGSAFYDAVIALPTFDPPGAFNTFRSRDGAYEDSHYGPTSETSYGERLRCVNARQLGDVIDDYADDDRWHAVATYLKNLGADARVALYWH